MLSPRRRSLRTPTVVRIVALISAAAVLAGCTSALAGSPTPATPAVVSGVSATPSAGGQITEPSVLPNQAGASTPDPSTTNSAAPGTTAETTTPTGPVPKGLAKFYAQALAWGSCASYATDTASAKLYASTTFQCARLTVPLAYDNPTGQTVQVAVLRKVATDASTRIGSLVMDPGGPGGSGMDFVASILASVNTVKPSSSDLQVAQLNKSFDLVGIDPRGVGSSLPAIACRTDAQRDAARAVDVRSRNQADVAAANAITKQTVADCVANTGKAQGIDGKTFLANVGTRDVARDLDVLRAALGDSKLTYAGFSYGTQIGWEYAEQFPANVRAILFDGDVSPIDDPATSQIDQNAAFEKAFLAFATWCAKSTPNCALGTDPNAAVSRYQSSGAPAARQEDRAEGRAGAVVRRCGVRHFRGAVRESAVDLPRPRAAEPVPRLR